MHLRKGYDLGKGAPITFDTLFKPGATPLDVLYPAVQRELAKHQTTAAPTLNSLDANAYQKLRDHRRRGDLLLRRKSADTGRQRTA